MITKSSSIKDPWNKLKNHQKSLIKFASMDSGGNDQAFEKMFSDIAFAYIQDKAPSLMDSAQGFQVIERSDDDSRAVGVIGFKINGMQIYSPVFFNQGEIKGNELLYLADQDIFVPLTESWINEIARRKPMLIGSGIDRADYQKARLQPDIATLRMPPIKFASYYPEWLWGCLGNFCKIAGNTKEQVLKNVVKYASAYKDATFFPDYIKYASSEGIRRVLDILNTYPLIKKAFDKGVKAASGKDRAQQISSSEKAVAMTDRPLSQYMQDFYDNKQLKEASRNLIDPSRVVMDEDSTFQGDLVDSLLRFTPNRTYTEKNAASVQIISYTSMVHYGTPFGMDDKTKERAAKDGYLVLDSRPDDKVSIIIKDYDDSQFFNPTRSGIYDLLVEPGKKKKFIVFKGESDREPQDLIVIDPETKTYVHEHTPNVWATHEYSKKDFKDWYDDLSADSLSTAEDKEILFVNERAGVLGPYKIQNELGSDKGQKVYRATRIHTDIMRGDLDEPSSYSASVNEAYHGHYNDKKYNNPAAAEFTDFSSKGDTVTIVYGREKGSRFSEINDTVYVPKDVKHITITRKDGRYSNLMHDVSRATGIKDGSFALSNPKRVKKALYEGVEDVKLFVKSGEASINNSPYMSIFDCRKALIKDFGLREQTANDMMKQADSNINGVCKFKIKRADVHDPARVSTDDVAPAFPYTPTFADNLLGFPGPVASDTNAISRVSSTNLTGFEDPYAIRPDSPYPAQDVQNISQAIENGQQEVFDTGMLEKMLTVADTETQVDKYVTKLIRGMNSVGRLLFLFYWKSDMFEDDYGPMKLPQLESSLKKAFTTLGDIILFLRRNKVNQVPFANAATIDLDDHAN